MPYKDMYLTLFDASAKAIELLIKGQQEAESIFIEHDASVSLIPNNTEDKDISLSPEE